MRRIFGASESIAVRVAALYFFAAILVLGIVIVYDQYFREETVFAPLTLSLTAESPSAEPGEMGLPVTLGFCNRSNDEIAGALFSTWVGTEGRAVTGPAVAGPVPPGCRTFEVTVPVSSLLAGDQWRLVAFAIVVGPKGESQTLSVQTEPVQIVQGDE